MVRNREEAVKAAEATTTNQVGMCQKVTRGWFDAPSAGDQDHDGDADAYDGWLSEPEWARHPGDRNPPRGVPVSFRGGRRGNGHRAISKGNRVIRSTDMSGGSYSPGHVGNTTIGQIEQAMGVTYLGWSKTIDGIPIPDPPQTPTRISRFLDDAPRYRLKRLDRAIRNGRRGVVKDVRDAIDAEVPRLRRVTNSPRINEFLRVYKEYRVLRIDLLNKAIRQGRTGIVKDVRARIMQQIHKLPER